MAVKFSPDLPDAANVLPPVARVGGRIRSITSSFELTTGNTDNADDRILLARLPSNAVLLEFSVGHDDLDGSTGLVLDFGLSDADGADIDTDGSSTSLDLFEADVNGQAATALTERRFGAPSEDTVDQRLWELVNNESSGTPFARDPNVQWFLCIAVSTAGTTPQAGTLFCRIRYVVD